ncbi:hypothetical protein [Streptomyces sp. KR55]|uniref:hypothetical protein n=1 Tax=Streptomyces sp. KR55 TaxID=3457425 RepID=UPI003FD58844
MRWYDRRDGRPGPGWLVRLWCGTAVLGIGASLWAFWLTYDDARDRAASEREIAAACGGLVSGEDVMNLRGGMVRAKPDDLRLDPESRLPGLCRIYRVPEPGHTDELFTLLVRTSSDGQPLHYVGDDVATEPFDYRLHEKDVTRQADHPEGRPLGDGSLGNYGDDFVTVRAECTNGTSDGDIPQLLRVTARAQYDEVSDGDRSRLAAIAHRATARAAAEIGCETRLHDLPATLAPVGATLQAADTADASCAWYDRYIARTGQGRLPDRMMEVPTTPRSAEEPCLLAMSPDRVRTVRWSGPEDAQKYGDSALTHSPWWMRTVSYFGPDTASVGYDDILDGDRYLKPGTAGGHEGGGILWASSTCDGQPAVHTLTISYTYDGVIGDRMQDVFRAYVDDITERRGCTDMRFPAGEDYDWD